jgi:hypothetical protein
MKKKKRIKRFHHQPPVTPFSPFLYKMSWLLFGFVIVVSLPLFLSTSPDNCNPTPQPCQSDSDCETNVEFCQTSSQSSPKCMKYKTMGESCGGVGPLSLQNRCLPGLICHYKSLGYIGTCEDPFKNCPSKCDSQQQFCSESGLCLPHGTCLNADDCNNPTNEWMRITSQGWAVCVKGKCRSEMISYASKHLSH